MCSWIFLKIIILNSVFLNKDFEEVILKTKVGLNVWDNIVLI